MFPKSQVVLRFAVERRSSKLQPDAATTRKLLVVTATTGREVAEAMPSKSDEPEKGEQPLGEPPQVCRPAEPALGSALFHVPMADAPAQHARKHHSRKLTEGPSSLDMTVWFGLGGCAPYGRAIPIAAC